MMQLSRNSRERSLRAHLLLGLAFFLICIRTIDAQELVKATTKTDPSEEVAVSERVRLLESELEKQNAKLDELQATINKQQAAIQALLERLEKPGTTTPSVVS